jgi:hypothetical protein
MAVSGDVRDVAISTRVTDPRAVVEQGHRRREKKRVVGTASKSVLFKLAALGRRPVFGATVSSR